MPKHIQDILVAVGIPAEDAAKIDSLPEADQATFDSKPYVDKVRTNYSTQLANDPAFFNDITIEKLPAETKKKVESAQFGRAAKIVTDKLLKGLGMTESEFDDLPPETKDKIENLIPVIAERYTKTKTGDKQLQQDLIEARKQLEKYGPDYEKGIETKHQTAAEQKITAAIFNAALVGELSSIPNLKVKASTLAREANEILNSKYSFERVGDYAVELRQKGNPQMKVLKENSSHELTLREALNDIATAEGWIEEKKDTGKVSGKVTITPGANGQLTMVPPHFQDKISQKIAAEK